MKSIALINQKGGVGKTTSTINIGSGLARLGKRVLLVDLDPQGSLSHSLAIDPDELTHTAYELFKQVAVSGSNISLGDYLISVPLVKDKLFLLPASLRLSALEGELKDYAHKDFIFRQVLSKLVDFDYVLVDCPASIGLLTLNALAAVDEVFVPVETEFLALQGLSQLAQTLDAISKSLNPKLRLAGIIGTKYNRRKLHKDTLDCIRSVFPEIVFKTVIRDTIAIAEAPSFGQDIYSYSPESAGAEDYTMLCKEILKQGQL